MLKKCWEMNRPVCAFGKICVTFLPLSVFLYQLWLNRPSFPGGLNQTMPTKSTVQGPAPGNAPSLNNDFTTTWQECLTCTPLHRRPEGSRGKQGVLWALWIRAMSLGTHFFIPMSLYVCVYRCHQRGLFLVPSCL